MQLALHRCSEPAVTVMAGSLWVCSLPDVRLGLQEVAERNSVPEVLMRGAQLQRPAWAAARVIFEGLSLEWTCGFGGIHRPIQVRAAKAFLAG